MDRVQEAPLPLSWEWVSGCRPPRVTSASIILPSDLPSEHTTFSAWKRWKVPGHPASPTEPGSREPSFTPDSASCLVLFTVECLLVTSILAGLDSMALSQVGPPSSCSISLHILLSLAGRVSPSSLPQPTSSSEGTLPAKAFSIVPGRILSFILT